MEWVPAYVIDALRGSHQLGIFVHVAFDPPLRLWFGVNDVPIRIESVDPDGAVYIGGGALQGVPELEVIVNGIADRVEFSLSGIDPDYMARWNIGDFDVRGAEVYVGITTLDETYQPMSAIIPLWDGRASFIRESMPPVGETESPTVTLTLSVGGGNTTRARNSASLWSHAHHIAMFPGDDFCKNTARLARGVAPSWPRF